MALDYGFFWFFVFLVDFHFAIEKGSKTETYHRLNFLKFKGKRNHTVMARKLFMALCFHTPSCPFIDQGTWTLAALRSD